MKNQKMWWTLGSAAVVAALAVVAWRESDLGRASRDLDAQIAAAHRERVPIEWEDLRRLSPPVSTAENAAVPYRRGFALLDSQRDLKAIKADSLTTAITAGKAKPEEIEKVRELLLKAGPGLEEITIGSTRPAISFDRKWERGPALLFPELAQGRNAERLLILRAMLAADPAAAARDLTTAARLRAHMGSEPDIISGLVGDAMEMDLHRALRYLGHRGAAWAAAVEPVLADLGPTLDPRRALAGESVSERFLTNELAKSGANAFVSMNGDSTPIALRLSGFKPVRDAFGARIVEYWRKVYGALPADPLDFKRGNAAMSMPIPNQGASYALLEMATPVFSSIGDMPAREEAERRLTRAALKLWQGQTDPLPDDPFGKGPMKFKPQGKGWSLWSVGPNGIDDGGRAKGNSNDVRYDLVVPSLPNLP